MELTLNLVWLVVAIAAILAQIVTFSSARTLARRPVNNGQKVIAMGCALVILFFVISMTDDLHDQQVMIEERKVSRIAARAETSANPNSAKSIRIDLFVFSLLSAFSLGTLAVRRGIENREFLPIAALDREVLFGRAPPPSFA